MQLDKDPEAGNEVNTDRDQHPPPPDGGYAAWLQVLASWLIFFNVLGVMNAYGEFQTLYETQILTHESSSTISWIGSVQVFLCYMTTILTGPLWDSGHLFPLLVCGTLASATGIMLQSLCTQYWQFFLAQAVLLGVGFGILFMPASAIVPHWFSNGTSLAVGVAVTGSSIGKLFMGFSRVQRLLTFHGCHRVSDNSDQVDAADWLPVDSPCHWLHVPRRNATGTGSHEAPTSTFPHQAISS